MFSETGLRKIEGFSASDPVVSLYLNTEPYRRECRNPPTAFTQHVEIVIPRK